MNPRAYNPRYKPRPEPTCSVSDSTLRPQLIHDASYLAALASATRAAPGAALEHGLTPTSWRQTGAKAAKRRDSLADRIQAHLAKARRPVLYSELRVALGTSAATIAGNLAREGYILRRRYSLAGQSGRVSEYLHATLKWPKLPPGAWGALYDHGAPKARPER